MSDFTDSIARLAEAIEASSRICVFTGAGISCPSGIPDFRSANGLYHSDSGYGYAPEEIISHSFLLRKPQIFFDFYKNKMIFPDAEPNDAHRYFAELEKHGKTVTVVTQNIDGLHAAAGSRDVCELHGSVWRNYCVKCGRAFGLETIVSSDGIPRCPDDNGMIRPDVVLYEEALDGEVIERAVTAIARAELLIVVGTSLTVYPAASFVGQFGGKTLALINRDVTPCDSRADLVIHEDIVKVVRALKESEMPEKA